MEKNNKQKNIKILSLSAMMAAIYVALDLLAVAVSSPFGGTMKISVSGLPVIIISVLFGPVWGMATGFVGAFIGQLVTYGMTATTFLWVLPATVRGLSMGLLFIAFKRSTKPYILVISTVISSMLVTAINTVSLYVDSKVYGYPAVIFGISLVNRIVIAIITAVVFAFVVPPIIKVIKKAVKI